MTNSSYVFSLMRKSAALTSPQSFEAERPGNVLIFDVVLGPAQQLNSFPSSSSAAWIWYVVFYLAFQSSPGWEVEQLCKNTH